MAHSVGDNCSATTALPNLVTQVQGETAVDGALGELRTLPGSALPALARQLEDCLADAAQPLGGMAPGHGGVEGRERVDHLAARLNELHVRPAVAWQPAHAAEVAADEPPWLLWPPLRHQVALQSCSAAGRLQLHVRRGADADNLELGCTQRLLGLAVVAGVWTTHQPLPLPLACGLTAAGDVAVWVVQPSMGATDYLQHPRELPPPPSLIMPASCVPPNSGNSAEDAEREAAGGAPLPYARGVPPALLHRVANGELRCGGHMVDARIAVARCNCASIVHCARLSQLLWQLFGVRQWEHGVRCRAGSAACRAAAPRGRRSAGDSVSTGAGYHACGQGTA